MGRFVSRNSNEGGGLKNRRLASVSFHSLTNEMKERRECAQKCAQNNVPKRVIMTTAQRILVAALRARRRPFEKQTALTALLSSASA
jgi:hypothetical protein